jgi:hypothetical protein
MTDREVMQQALEALEQYTDVVTSVNDPNSWATVADGGKPAREAITALRDRLAQPDRIQLTVRDFVVTVGGIEDAVGTPMYWTEWPNKEQP